MTLNSINQYGHDFQIKVISSLLTHKEFLTNIHDIISTDYFENQAQKWVIQEVLRYYDKYHTTPSLDILKVELQKVDNDVLQLSIKEQLKLAFVSSDEDLAYVQEEFTNFCRNQQLKKWVKSGTGKTRIQLKLGCLRADYQNLNKRAFVIRLKKVGGNQCTKSKRKLAGRFLCYIFHFFLYNSHVFSWIFLKLRKAGFTAKYNLDSFVFVSEWNHISIFITKVIT